MGIIWSKNKKQRKSDSTTSNVTSIIDSFNKIDSLIEHETDKKKIKELYKDFEENPSLFVLNLMLMSVMFFENFEKEVRQRTKPTTDFEINLNKTLLKEYSKRCFMPDACFQDVNKNLRFQRKHGPKKNDSEALIPERLYIIHDNIEAVESQEPSYNLIDKPNIQARIESTKKPGFVKLILSEEYDTRRSSSTSTNSAELSTESEQESFSSNSTEVNAADNCENESSEYDYIRITDSRTPKLLFIDNSMNKMARLSDMPDSCITAVRLKNKPESDEENESDRESNISDEAEELLTEHQLRFRALEEKRKQQEEEEYKLFKTVSYLNSEEFMKHFQSQVFPNYVAEKLKFEEEEIKKATVLPGVIFCSHYDNGVSTCYEITPAISIKQSQIPGEWVLRPGPIDKKIWPGIIVTKEVHRMESLIIPRGFIQKRGQNVESYLEWEFEFPHAEKHLLTKMTHEQVKCYLYLILLHKTFIEPKTQKNGLLVDHLRALIFLECQGNFLNWPVDKLGQRLLKVLNNLRRYLGNKHLPNYFDKSKNLFENIPGKYLRMCQQEVHEIIQSPTMYFLAALRNLKYNNPKKFYPYPDFTELYSILTNKNKIRLQIPLENHELRTQRKHKYNYKYNSDQKWQMQAIRQKKKEIDEKKQAEEARAKRKESVDSINLDFNDFASADNFQKTSILKFFIDHFIEIARASKRMAYTRQLNLYINYSHYLTKILETYDGFFDDVKMYKEKIAKLEKKTARESLMETDKAPATPLRNSVHFFGNQQDHLSEKPSTIGQYLSNYSEKPKKRVVISEPQSN